jgi:hypothetical protein
MVSNYTDFEQKAADIIRLYLNPPQRAAVFCVDEKTAIQALDRLDPVPPLSPTRVPIEEKESICWLESLKYSTELLGEARRCVHIGSRERHL